MSGDARKFAVDAAVGRAALGAASVWESAIDGDAVAGGVESESQASATAVESDGDRGDLSEAFPQPGSGWARDLSVPIAEVLANSHPKTRGFASAFFAGT